LLPGASAIDEGEAHEMTRSLHELARPRNRDDLELVHAGREGTYWQAADGLIVRLATPEGNCDPERDAETVQRDLLALACRDAAAQ
jgi:hypothetical protein